VRPARRREKAGMPGLTGTERIDQRRASANHRGRAMLVTRSSTARAAGEDLETRAKAGSKLAQISRAAVRVASKSEVHDCSTTLPRLRTGNARQDHGSGDVDHERASLRTIAPLVWRGSSCARAGKRPSREWQPTTRAYDACTSGTVRCASRGERRSTPRHEHSKVCELGQLAPGRPRRASRRRAGPAQLGSQTSTCL
jgi:hypothetical protein